MRGPLARLLWLAALRPYPRSSERVYGALEGLLGPSDVKVSPRLSAIEPPIGDVQAGPSTYREPLDHEPACATAGGGYAQTRPGGRVFLRVVKEDE